MFAEPSNVSGTHERNEFSRLLGIYGRNCETLKTEPEGTGLAGEDGKFWRRYRTLARAGDQEAREMFDSILSAGKYMSSDDAEAKDPWGFGERPSVSNQIVNFPDVQERPVVSLAYAEKASAHKISFLRNYAKSIAAGLALVGIMGASYTFSSKGKRYADHVTASAKTSDTPALSSIKLSDIQLPANAANIPAAQNVGDYKIYEVKKGDVYWAIAKNQMNTTRNAGTAAAVRELMNYNGAATDSLKIGDKIKIPKHANFDDTTNFQYTVKKGNTLSGISVFAYGTNKKVDDIKIGNGLTGDTIYAGQQLELKMPSWKVEQLKSRLYSGETKEDFSGKISSYESAFGYSPEQVTERYNKNIAAGMSVESAYMKAIGKADFKL